MTNELSKPQEPVTALAISKPQGVDFELSESEIITPRVKLFNGLPKEYIQFPDAKPGTLISTFTKKELPSVFIPIKREVCWIRFNPQNQKNQDGSTNPDFDLAFEPGALIYKTCDPNDPRVIKEAAWGANGEKPKALKFINYLSFFPGVDIPLIFSFYKTTLDAAKVIDTEIYLHRETKSIYEHSFKVSVFLKKTGNHEHYSLKALYNGKPNPEDLAKAKELYESFTNKQITTNAEFSE